MSVLLSLPQLRNLRLTIEIAAEAVFLTCQAFGYFRTPAQMATSQHIVVNLVEIKKIIANQSRVSEHHSFVSTQIGPRVAPELLEKHPQHVFLLHLFMLLLVEV